ncbi:DUF2637 domain-containing protein [Actinocorallia populi]|uniref:DUF2637 domain-containing protein n=1 Tax=Actinocorallia populi TaxID=2079200 RepID=UPI000D08B27F|nr:DUF2637 domain-containing protein [Actinocorallia populi]
MTVPKTILWCQIALVPLIAALAALGAVGSFATVRDASVPYFGEQLAWIVPIGLDLGIFVLLAWDLLLELQNLAWPILRWIAWAYIGGTITVNVTAADGDPAGMIAHAAMPVLFITVTEGVRHQIRQRAGLAAGTRREKIPVSRWALAPASTLLLWRRMVLWQITSYAKGLSLEQERLVAVSKLQQSHGRFRWRWKAPLSDRLALRIQPADDVHQDDDIEELVTAAQKILTIEENSGVQLSNINLGRRLRAQGYSVANDKLAAVGKAARARMDGAQP